MISNKERWVYFYDFKFTPYPEGSENIPLIDLIKGLKKLVASKEAVKFYRNNTAALRVTNVKYQNNDPSITLLIQLADKNIADPAFSNIEKGDLRRVEKEIGEGVAITAHVTISMKPHINQNIYLVAIEKVPGISSGKLASFLTAMFKAIRANENLRWEDESGRNMIHFPQISSEGHLSESLKNDLEEGTLRGFEFISYDTSENDAFDQEPYLRPQERVLRVGVSRFESGSSAWEIVKSAHKAFNKVDYDKLKVKIKKDDSERWVHIDLEDIESTALVRHEKITLDDEIKSQCLSKINNEMEKMMIRFVVGEQEE